MSSDKTLVSCEENDTTAHHDDDSLAAGLMSHQNVDLTIVLLCGGSGSLAHTYRPANDESQWWGRRDALVRCVTTSLFSSHGNSTTSPDTAEASSATASSAITASTNSTQLMLLYEEDMSLFHMTRRVPQPNNTIHNTKSLRDKNNNGNQQQHKQHTSSSSWTIPTEQNIIRAWKQAAMRANNNNNNNREPSTTKSSLSKTNTIGSLIANHNHHNTSVTTQEMSPLNVTCYQDAWRHAATGDLEEEETVVSSSDKGSHNGNPMGGVGISQWNSLDTSGSNKREVLEHLRQSCSMEFLRQHRLNSPVDVVLRKTNRTKLVHIWKLWIAEQQQQQQPPSQEQIEPKQNTIDPEQVKTKQMELIFKGILSGKYQSKSGDKTTTTTTGDKDNVMAVYLHETCGSELPCFPGSTSFQPVMGQQQSHHTAEGVDSGPAGRRPPKRVCLFLGAVRDMHPWEYQALQNACRSSSHDMADGGDGGDGDGRRVPLMGMRLGPVPEFTSKILSVVVQHNARGVLGPALHRLQLMTTTTTTNRSRHPQQQDELQSFLANGMGHAPHHATHKRQKRSKHDSTSTTFHEEKAPKVPRRRRRVHVVYTVSLDSSQLSCELSCRTRDMWCLVRVCVSCLWRSRLASSATTSTTTTTDDTCLDHDGLENCLSICFQDGLILTLEQEELVLSLASQHQAAPSEYQVLAALCRKRDEALIRRTNNRTASKNMDQRDFAQAHHQTIASAAAAFPKRNVYALKVVDTEGMGEKNTLKRIELVRLVYGEKEPRKKKIDESCKDGGELLFVLLRMLPDSPLFGLDHEKTRQQESMEKRTFDVLGIPVTHQSILGSRRNVEDWEGSTITMLQHFDYQGLLFSSIKQIKAIRKASRKSMDRVEEIIVAART
eukprot:scaffold7218_cov52-Attheya_sp.AAC.4